jgi:hypothetical protein
MKPRRAVRRFPRDPKRTDRARLITRRSLRLRFLADPS